MLRALLAKVRICGGAYTGGEPHPALLVYHRIVNAGMAVPNDLVPPIHRGALWQVRRRRRRWIPIGMLNPRGLVVNRVENRDPVSAFLGRPIDRTISIDRGIAIVGGDRVVQIGFVAAPIPQCDDDIALNALRSLGL